VRFVRLSNAAGSDRSALTSCGLAATSVSSMTSMVDERTNGPLAQVVLT